MTSDTLYEDGNVVHEPLPLSALEDKLEEADRPLEIVERHATTTGGVESTRQCDICPKEDVMTKMVAVQGGTAEICVHCQGLMDAFDTGVDKPDVFDKRLIGH